MAKIGYYNGDPQQILKAPVNIVLSILDYENFETEYLKEYQELNKEKK